ncbi:hypothetical protein ABW21_db0200634 [Orbilia brochopaga]|nr:hypothetical protein ABW21_db0200634 [Drechslerella brochopaga]
MPIAGASRQLIAPKWCPSCSLALLRAFASAAGTPLPSSARQLTRSSYRSIKTTASATGLRAYRNSRANGIYQLSLTSTLRAYTRSTRDEKEDNFEDITADFPPDYLETEDGEFISIQLSEAQKRRHDKISDIHQQLEIFEERHWDMKHQMYVDNWQVLREQMDERFIRFLDEKALAREKAGEPVDETDQAIRESYVEVLEDLRKEASWRQPDLASIVLYPVETDAGTTKEQSDSLRETENTNDTKNDEAMGTESLPGGDSTAASAQAVFTEPATEVDSIPNDPHEPNETAEETADNESESDSVSVSPQEEQAGIQHEKYTDLQAEIQEMETMILEDLETQLTGISVRKSREKESALELAAMRRSVVARIDGTEEKLQELENRISTATDLDPSGPTVLEARAQDSAVRSSDKFMKLYSEVLLGHTQTNKATQKLAATLRSQIEEAEQLLQEIEDDIDAVSSTSAALQADQEDIEYRVMESPASPQPTDGTPWYLQEPLQPAPRRFVSPLIEQMPEMPPNPPETLEPLLNFLLKDLSLSKMKVMDLRGLEPVPALGPNVLMILATARSERHMHIAADKCCRFMRGMLGGADVYADGLMGTGEMKLRERRERRKGKRRTAEEEEGLRVGWISVNSGQGLVVQILTGWKREELNLEGLWSRKINTSQKRKLRDQLAAEGLSFDEIKERVAAELPYEAELPPIYDLNAEIEEPDEIQKEVKPPPKRQITAARVAKVIQIGPPPTRGRRVQLEEFRDVRKTVEIHSKSRKKQEGKRYIDIPAHKPGRVSTRGKQKALKASLLPKAIPVRERPSVSFSTRFDTPRGTRQYSTVVEVATKLGLPESMFSLAEREQHAAQLFAKEGNYQELLKLYPRPRTDEQTTLILIAHLNHLVLLPPDEARAALLAAEPDAILSTPFFLSFERSLPFRKPSLTHNHLKFLLYVTAHKLSPLTFPINWYIRLLTNIRQSGLQVPLQSYHVALRALATSEPLRGDHPVTVKFWTSRTTEILSLMNQYILRHMDVAGIDVGHDPEVFESLWLALASRDTGEYIATLGDPTRRRTPIDSDKPFSRALDHRVSLYKEFHMRWYDPIRFVPRECQYLRGVPLATATLDRLLHPSLVYPPRRPDNRYSILPSYLVTMFVTLARWEAWRWVKHVWRWLPSQGVQRPKTLYALYLELLAREASVDRIITDLRAILTDYEQEFANGMDEPVDGVAEGLLACVDLVEKRVPGTGQEFGRWRRRCQKFLGHDRQWNEENYTYVI